MSPSASSSRLTSRRAKNMEKKLVMQIVFFLLLSVVLVAVFALVVVPNVIKLMSGSNVSTQIVVKPSSVPPQIPFVAAPIAATNSAQLTVTGFSQIGNQIVILDNSQELSKADVQNDGSFSASITLQTGDNLLTAYAINKSNKQQSAVSQANLVNFNDQAPKLDLTQPTDGQTNVGSKNQKLSIQGTTDPGSKVSLNDGLVFVNADGTFTSTFQLSSGDNNLDFKATNAAGNSTEKKLTVHYSP